MCYTIHDKARNHEALECIAMTKRIDKFEDWLPANKAAHLLSDKLGRPIQPRYLRQLAKRTKNPIKTQSLGYHQLYNRVDIETITVRQRKP